MSKFSNHLATATLKFADWIIDHCLVFRVGSATYYFIIPFKISIGYGELIPKLTDANV